MSWAIQAAIAAVIFAAGGMGGIKWHAGQDAIAENARLERVREDARLNRATENNQAKTVIGAVNESRKREAVARAAADSARTERDGLRDDLAALRAGLPGLAADACRERAATISELLDQCTGAYQGLARTADGHAADTLTLERAWPRSP